MPKEMDVTGSLRKISRELLALEREDPELEARLEAAAFLIKYIADALDVELEYAAARGRALFMKSLADRNNTPFPEVKFLMSGDDI